MKNWLVFSFLFVGLISCNNESETEEKEETKSTNVEEPSENLTLNNEKKWKVNPETHEGMTQIKVILDNMDPLTLEDYKLMGEACNEQTSFIISNCSMKGEPHNQLHEVLHPILDDIDNLINSKTDEEAGSASSSLEENIGKYFTYFEL